MNKTFFISDTHFFQPEILAIDGIDPELYLDSLVKQWRSKVDPEDTVFHLGDVGIYDETVMDIFYSLPGKKMLIMGNHDRNHSPDQWRKMKFSQVYEYPIIYEGFYILSHEPVYLSPQMPYANIHGQLHLNNMISSHKVNRYINVSWSNIQDQGLLSFDEIKSRFN